MFPWNGPRTPQQNRLKFTCTSTYLLFLLSPSLGDGGIQFYRPFVNKWFLCNNLKTPQHNHIKITCLKMLRTSDTDKGRISLCGVFCIFRFLSNGARHYTRTPNLLAKPLPFKTGYITFRD